MNDDFEQKLQRQPLRPIPHEWRKEILAAAHEAAGARHSSLITRHSFFSTLNSQLSTLLWPNPKAWAALAAVWLGILVINFASHDKTPPLEARRTTQPSPEMLVVLRQQEELRAELFERAEPRDADRPKSAPPRPRSEWRTEILTA